MFQKYCRYPSIGRLAVWLVLISSVSAYADEYRCTVDAPLEETSYGWKIDAVATTTAMQPPGIGKIVLDLVAPVGPSGIDVVISQTECEDSLTCAKTFRVGACYASGKPLEMYVRAAGSNCATSPGFAPTPLPARTFEPEIKSFDGRIVTFHSAPGGTDVDPSLGPFRARVRLNAYPNVLFGAGANIGSGDTYELDDTGVTVTTDHSGFNPPAGTTGVLATVITCDGSTHTMFVPKSSSDKSCDGADGSCCSCVGDPVHVGNGNMRYTERDPLPSNRAFHWQRVYDSVFDRNVAPGPFGYGWYSPFDASLAVSDNLTMQQTDPALQDEEQLVVIRTENNDQIAFARRLGQYYERIYPQSNGSGATLTSNSSEWIFRDDQSQRERRFDRSTGRLTSMTSLSTGEGVTLSYSSGLPYQLTDAWGRWTVTFGSSNGRITSAAVDGQSSMQWLYDYDTDGNLTAVRDSSNANWRTYTYSSAHELTEIRDGRNALLESHDYTATAQVGVATTSSGPSAEIQSIRTFTSTPLPSGIPAAARNVITDEQLTRVTYHNAASSYADYYSRVAGGSRKTVQIIGSCTSCGMNDVTNVYDRLGNLVARQDGRGYITLQTFDTKGRMLTSGGPYRPNGCDPASDSDHCRRDPDQLKTMLGTAGSLVATPAARTTSHTYGDTAWPDRPTVTSTTSVVDPAHDSTETLSFDASSGEVLSRVVSGYTMNRDGQTVAETHSWTTTLYTAASGEQLPFTPGGAFQSSWASLPQPKGLRKTIDGPLAAADSTAYVYYPVDAAVPATWRGRLAAIRDPLGHVTRFEGYDAFGNVTRTVDANGFAMESTYDALGRLLTATGKGTAGCTTTGDALCATDLTSSLSYDPASGPLDVASSPTGGVTAYGYDSRGRTSLMARGSSAATLQERMEYDYDSSSGLKTAERRVDLSTGTAVVKTAETYAYDDANRLAARQHADGYTVAYAYDRAGNMTSVKDENHTSPNTTFRYDEAGRLVETKQLLGTTQLSTVNGYDRNGNLVSIQDPNGNVTAYVYDDFGRMVRQTSPVSGTTVYEYEAAGNLTYSKDANGATTTRVYDLLNRATSATSVRPGRAGDTVTWSYDSAANGVGRLASIATSAGVTTAYQYNKRGLLKTEQTTIAGVSYTTSYDYDASGNRTTIVYPSSRVATYTYDYANRPASVTSASTTIISAAKYLPFGPAIELTFGNGTVKSMSYDTRYRPSQNTLTGPSATIAHYAYTSDPAGNITAIDDLLDTTYNRAFGYDSLNRLTSVATGSSLFGSGTYSYDAMGNMLSLSLGTYRSASFSYSGTTPKLASVTENGVTQSVTYDAAGNETSVGTAASAYSSRNQLMKSGAVSYVYDGRGVRSLMRALTLDVSLAQAQVDGGNSVSGTVTLFEPAPSGGAVVSLSSSNTAALAIPASITIAAGQLSGTFTASTSAVSATTAVSVTASRNGAGVTAFIDVVRGVEVASLVLDPVDVLATNIPSKGFAGQATGTITLNMAAPVGGVPVAISCPDADCPSSVTVPQASTSATFTVTGSARAPVFCPNFQNADCPVTYQVTATFVTQHSASFTVHTLDDGSWGTGLDLKLARDVFLATLAVAPERIAAGGRVLMTVGLSAPAPQGGMSVTLAASDASVVLPARVTIPEGQQSITFDVATSPVVTETIVRVTAEAHGISRETTVVLLPHAGTRRPFLALSLTADLVSTTHSASGDAERHYLYTPDLNLLAETSLSTTPALTHEYIWFAGQPVAQVDLASTTIHWIFTDHLGTPLLETDATGAVDWRAEQEPYGRVYAFRAGSTRHQPLRFPGQEYDDAVGDREYNIFRWYRDGWGRYTQADPIGGYGDTNRYGYADANPPRQSDPLGLYTVAAGSPGEKQRIDAAMTLLRQEMQKNNCSTCKQYFAAQPGLSDLAVWTQPGGPPYLSVVNPPANVPLRTAAFSQKGSPWTFSFLFNTGFPPSPKTFSACDLASLILHEAGHLARHDITDNEPVDFFNKCTFGCIKPGRWK